MEVEKGLTGTRKGWVGVSRNKTPVVYENAQKDLRKDALYLNWSYISSLAGKHFCNHCIFLPFSVLCAVHGTYKHIEILYI